MDAVLVQDEDQSFGLRARPFERRQFLDAEGGEKAKTFLLRALEVAVLSGDPATAKEATDSIVRPLEQAADELTDQEKAALEKSKAELAAIANK